MSSSNPPYPYYNGIPFNPAFFTSTTNTSSGLTETEANALYLRKTTPDTASALETFNGGIVTTSVSSTGALSIGASNNSITNIASGNGSTVLDATGAVNIKTGNNNTGTISIGKYTNATNQTTTTISGDANISNTGGIVNIGTQSARNTAIRIGTGSNTGLQGFVDINSGPVSQGQTSINSGYNSTGTILIGGTNATQECNILAGQIDIGTIPPTENTRNITIGATDGGFNSNTALNGNTTILGLTNINNSGATNTNIGNVSSTTSIVGPININNSGASNSFIGNASSTTTIAGTTNINTTIAQTTTIGNSGAVNNILGTTSINTSGVATTSIGANGSTTAIIGPTNINISSGQTTTIGTTSSGTTTVQGTLNLGTFGSNMNMKNIQTLDYTNAVDASLLNTITTTTGTNVNIDLTRLGQTQLVYRSANSSSIANNTDTTLFTTTVLKTGIYSLSYQARYFATDSTSVARGVQTWLYVSSPSAYGQSNLGQLALNLVGYASPYLALQATGVSMTSAWTGLINANATVALRCYIEYNTASANGALIGGISSNYLTFTRIA